MVSLCSSVGFGAVADTGNSEDFLSIDASNISYGSSGSVKIIDGGVACPAVYSPVCAEVVVQCIKAPCNPVRQTFSNSCMAGKNKVLFQGTCDDLDSALSVSINESEKLLEISYFDISPLDDGGISLNLAFLNNVKTDFKVTYYSQFDLDNKNSFYFYNRNSVGLEIHTNYTIPNSDFKLDLKSNNVYLLEVTDLSGNIVYRVTEFETDKIDLIIFKQPIIYTVKDTSFSPRDGKFGQTCEAWLREQNIKFYFLSTTIHEGIFSDDFQEKSKNSNCIYKHGNKAIIEHYQKNSNPNSYPVSAVNFRGINSDITDEYFMRVEFDSKYYNSLKWESLDNVPDGKWGQSCYEWLDEKGFDNHEIRAYDSYGALSPTTCAYIVSDLSGEYCMAGGANGNFVQLNNRYQDIKPVAHCYSNSLKISSQVANLEDNVEVIISEPPISKCRLLDINLINTTANDAKFFDIVSENCVGEFIDIEIYEDDSLFDDLVEIMSIRVLSDKQEEHWVYKNSDDGVFGGEPEFYFNFENFNSMIFSRN
jgi:hypothetical protein